MIIFLSNYLRTPNSSAELRCYTIYKAEICTILLPLRCLHSHEPIIGEYRTENIETPLRNFKGPAIMSRRASPRLIFAGIGRGSSSFCCPCSWESWKNAFHSTYGRGLLSKYSAPHVCSKESWLAFGVLTKLFTNLLFSGTKDKEAIHR